MKRFYSIFIKSVFTVAVAVLAVGGGYRLWQNLTHDQAVEALIFENTQLRQAIANLTEETQIGYAKVLRQDHQNGVLTTRLLFVETVRRHQSAVFEKEFEIEGDIVHFDALIVKFSTQWSWKDRKRRIYGVGYMGNDATGGWAGDSLIQRAGLIPPSAKIVTASA